MGNAASILYFNDYNVGTDRMAQALAISGHTVNTVSSSSAFASEIGSGKYDLGILFAQNYGANNYADGINALGAFVAGGGSAIYTDYSMNNNYASLFGSQWSGSYNQSSFYVTDSLLANSLPTNPVGLYNPGWGIYSMDVNGQNVAAVFGNGQGAIAINGKSITNGFLSDTFVDGATGTQLYLNEINYVAGGSPAVPEPGTLFLLGSGLIGFISAKTKNKIRD